MSIHEIKKEIAEWKQRAMQKESRDDCATGYICALSAVEKLLAGHGEMTSIKDGPPKEDGEYLCAVSKPVNGLMKSDGYRIIRFYTFEPLFGYNGWQCDGIVVTHWMELPELPDGSDT